MPVNSSNTIRNVRQTAQERTVIKTAPDLIIYLDGIPYLENPYISGPGTPSTLVNFNDYLVGFTSSYDTENLIPTCSMTFSVPAHKRYLFQAPGGQNLFVPMKELQIFAKGYFPSASGNTVYYRVFKGLTSHVSHTDTGKVLEISIQGQGSLRWFELMQIDVSPSLLTNSGHLSTTFATLDANLDPYEIIAQQFMKGLTFEGWQYNSILQENVKGSDFEQAAQAQYINKWQKRLVELGKDVHIFGYTFNSLLPQDAHGIADSSDVKGREGPEFRSHSEMSVGKLLESDPHHDLYTGIMKGYLPEYKIGAIQLLNGQIVNRLERIRTMINAIGMEGFQDINGEIIVKPPLYNLDVTDTTPVVPSQLTSTQNAANANQKFTDENNPFVVLLDEIENETETEDEKGIRATRVTIQPEYLRTAQFTTGTEPLREAVWHIDIAKLAQFGLREEPARTLGWLTSGDKIAAYSYAVGEMNKANRSYRTYTFTIPLRPELKLGFPMYFPHRDMFGYIRSVSISYQYGGAATMSVMCDTIRKCPMFPTVHTSNDIDPNTGQPKQETIYASQPNLVMKWTEPPKSATQLVNETASGFQSSKTNLFENSGLGAGQKQGDTADFCSINPQVNWIGNPSTLRKSSQEPVYPEKIQRTNYREYQLGTYWGTMTDTVSKSFRVQNDIEPDGSPFFSRDRWLTPRQKKDDLQVPMAVGSAPLQDAGINMTYYNRILTMQPLTDERGYEVVTPFPWGRWKSLNEAYAETRESKLVAFANAQDLKLLTGVTTFLFAGLGTPTGSLDPGSKLSKVLSDLSSQVSAGDSFEIAPYTPTQPGGENEILSSNQPQDGVTSDAYLVVGTALAEANKISTFISGSPAPSAATQADLSIALEVNNMDGNPVNVSKNPVSQTPGE